MYDTVEYARNRLCESVITIPTDEENKIEFVIVLDVPDLHSLLVRSCDGEDKEVPLNKAMVFNIPTGYFVSESGVVLHVERFPTKDTYKQGLTSKNTRVEVFHDGLFGVVPFHNIFRKVYTTFFGEFSENGCVSVVNLLDNSTVIVDSKVFFKSFHVGVDISSSVHGFEWFSTVLEGRLDDCKRLKKVKQG